MSQIEGAANRHGSQGRSLGAPLAVLFGILVSGSGRPLLAAELPSLAEVVENVRANERLYDNIELIIRSEYRLLHSGRNWPKLLSGAPTKKRITRMRMVLQGEQFYFQEATDTVAADNLNKKLHSTTESAYDGNVTRSVSNKDLANIRHELSLDPRIMPPHTFLYNRWCYLGPLSQYLTIKDQGPMSYRWAVLGEETVDSLRCIKLELVAINKNWKKGPIGRVQLWLAVDRNYLPIKIQTYSWANDKIPAQQGRVSELKQAAPGIWMPFKTRIEGCDHIWLKKKGQSRPGWEHVYSVEKATIDPKYDKSLFEEIAIPKGAMVYRVKDGKIVNSWVEGEGEGEPTQKSRTWLLVLLIGIGLCAAAALAWLYRRGRAARTADSHTVPQTDSAP